MKDCKDLSINIKAQFGEEIRRVVVTDPSDLSWNYVSTRLSNVFGINSESLIIKYKDEEGDLITVSSTEELKEAIDLFQSQSSFIRFIVNQAPGSSGISASTNVESESSVVSISSRDFDEYEYGTEERNENMSYADLKEKRMTKKEWKAQKKLIKQEKKRLWKNKGESKEQWKEEKRRMKEEKIRMKEEYKKSRKQSREAVREDFKIDLAKLESMGFTQKGFNSLLLRKHKDEENRIEKVIEILTKNSELHDRGNTKTGLNLRLLMKFNGDLEKVEKCLAEKASKQSKKNEFNKKLEMLRERGYHRHGVNRMLLHKMDGDIDKVIVLLQKNKLLQEKGFEKMNLNVRLLLKFGGDVSQVEDFLIIKSNPQLKAEKKQFKKEKRLLKKESKYDKEGTEKSSINQEKNS